MGNNVAALVALGGLYRIFSPLLSVYERAVSESMQWADPTEDNDGLEAHSQHCAGETVVVEARALPRWLVLAGMAGALLLGVGIGRWLSSAAVKIAAAPPVVAPRPARIERARASLA